MDIQATLPIFTSGLVAGSILLKLLDRGAGMYIGKMLERKMRKLPTILMGDDNFRTFIRGIVRVELDGQDRRGGRINGAPRD